MRYQANVLVRLKPGVLDPQGQTILEAARSLGFQGFREIRAGKQFALEVEAKSEAAARALVDQLSHKLLANPIIEVYAFDLSEARPPSEPPAGRRKR
jgi:phosphoribosylformylglycinamidine synthase